MINAGLVGPAPPFSTGIGYALRDIGIGPMSRGAEPIPVEDGGAGPTSPALIIIRDEAGIEEPVRGPYVRSGHDSNKGLVEGSPVGLVLGLNQSLQWVNPRDRVRTQASKEWIVSDSPRQ